MYLLKIASPLILAFGLIANILSLYIFTSKKMNNLPTFKFLAYLSLIDCLHIATGIPHIMSITYSDYDFRNTSSFICSFHSFLTIYLSHLSSNVLAAVGVFRCTQLTSTKQLAKNITKLKSRHFFQNFGRIELIMLVIMLILFIFDCHFLIFMRLIPNPFQNQTENQTINYICYSSSMPYNEFYLNVWPWIDLFLYSYIPFLVMITSTIIIIYKLCSANVNLKKRYEPSETSIELTTEKCSKTKKEVSENKFAFEAAKRRSQRNNQVYRLLLSLNVLFFILVTPIVFCNSIKLLDKHDEAIIELVYVLAYLNHCINFVLYGLTCELFRIILIEKFKNLIYLCSKRPEQCGTDSEIEL